MADDKTFKMLIEEQRRTTAVVEKSMMSAEERAVVEAAERNKFEKRSEASTRGAETKRINILTRKNNTQTASQEESSNDSNSYLRDTFKSFLGKGSLIAGKLGNIGDGLKSKVKGGLEGIFKAIKTGAFVALLLGLTKFLQSETFKDIKDKYLPSIVKGLNSLGATLKGIVDGFFDEGGNFKLSAGLLNIAGSFGSLLTVFAVGGVLMKALMPNIFFGTLMFGGKLFGKALGKGASLALGFGKLLLSMTGLGTSLTNTGTAMADTLLRSQRSGGIFDLGGGPGRSRRGRGIVGRFGKLFKFFGKKKGLAGLIIGAGIGMAALLDGAKIGETVGNAFSKLTGVVSNFASSLKDVALKAAAATAKAVTKALSTVAKIGAKVLTPATKLSKKALDALRGTGKFAFKPTTPKLTTPKLNAAQRAALSGTGEAFKNSPKLATTISKAVLKKSIGKQLALLAAKAIPAIGLVVGGGLALGAAFRGDFLGASMEAGGMLLPSLAGLPVDAAIMARNIYKENYGIFPEKETDNALRLKRMKQIVAAVKSSMTSSAEIQPSDSQSTAMKFGAVTSGNNRNLNLVPNMAYDYNNDGRVSMGEKRNKSGEAFGQPTLIAPVTNIVTTNNNSSEKSYFSKALTMQDPVIAAAIGAH